MTMTCENAVDALAAKAGIDDQVQGLTDPLGSWYDAKDTPGLEWLADRYRPVWTAVYLRAQGWSKAG